MKDYHIFSCATTNFLPFIKSLIHSLKRFKKEDCRYYYHIFLDEENIQEYQQILNRLSTDDFKIQVFSLQMYKKVFVNPNSTLPFSAYARCFVCSMFPNLDKILYLDVDLFIINEGLEQLMDKDLNDNYIAAIVDVCPLYKNFPDVQNTKSKGYFNSGVGLFNLKKIREDGLDKKLESAITGHWPYNEIQPICHDQTLLNYLFKDHTLLVDPKFNNNFHASMIEDLKYFKQQYGKWGYTNLLKSISDAVIIHWAGVKPWWGDYFNQRKAKMSVWQVNKFIFEYFIKEIQ